MLDDKAAVLLYIHVYTCESSAFMLNPSLHKAMEYHNLLILVPVAD